MIFFKLNKGCYFHFGQALWKNVQDRGLVRLYGKDKDVRRSFNYLKLLAFLPVRDVIPAFVAIQAKAPVSLKSFISYFENTYIGKRVRNRPNMRQRPLFSIEWWNVHERVLLALGRTNNNLEAWHNAFHVSV